jgi:hypothetical protein
VGTREAKEKLRAVHTEFTESRIKGVFGNLDTEGTEKLPAHSRLSLCPLYVLLCDLCVKRFFGH